MPPILIIGSGLAGYTLAREIRKLDKQIPVLVISQDNGDFYSKPNLSNALSKNQSSQDLVIKSAEQMEKQHNIIVRSQSEVTQINTNSQEIKVGDENIAYKKLVLAIGAQPRQLDISGLDGDQIFHINNLIDYGNFRDQLAPRQSVAIVGAGLIGCEFANDLCKAGYNVHVIAPSPHPLASLVTPKQGNFVRQQFQKIGIHWHLPASIQSAEQHSEIVQLNIQNSSVQTSTIQVNKVLCAIGLEPNLELANNAAIKTDRAIVVDDCLQTSQENIYALGDCMELRGRVLPFVLPIMECAKALAKTLLGSATPVRFPLMPVTVKTPAAPLVVVRDYCSDIAENQNTTWQETVADDGISSQLLDSSGILKGFIVSGDQTSNKSNFLKTMQFES